MSGAELTGLAVLLPLAGFILNGLLGARLRSEAVSGIVGCAAVGGSFLIALMCLVQLLGLPPAQRVIDVPYAPWIAAGSFHADMAFQVDQLSVLMMLVVTGVGFLIHVYSIGYMHGDPGFWRFFAYLNLFIVAMLILILADNFLLMFLGWEGVGLCSYLLIGFWYDRKFEKGTTAEAAKKAFVVNRIGDFGFLIGMFLIFVTFGSLKFQTVFAQAAALPVGTPVALWIALALFLGATGKSAQIPLFVWLPDAMAGPTPVSALIHAATMVTAGVYMVARCAVLYAIAPGAMAVVAVIGVLTALMAATIGLVQNDIKKVLAYSTISQLGYMFLALGVGAFSAGLFHVMTHAFFKALLFLGSGAVIHAMHDEQDIRKMGGLRAALPVTFWTFLAGTIAIAGIPPFAGFFSKDEILWNAFARGNWVLWAAGAAGAGLTALYMFRLVALTFTGEPRWEKGTHPHEAPMTMAVPLVILAFLSIVGGFIGWPESLGGSNAFERWLEPVFAPAGEKLALVAYPGAFTEYMLMACSVAIALGGAYLAYAWYARHREIPGALVRRFAGVYRVLLNKYYVDEVYEGAVVQPTVKTAEVLLWKGVDVTLIDGFVNGLARAAAAAGGALRRVQTGVVQNYVLVFLAGAVALVGWLLVK
ncbi:MAG TPA: NADH-quinone oxidoreductase subunit L [Bacteroidota bacterium]|nr:NADH-quinone oxidoreductase subunit L [Bacteroidota bacterium]